MGPTVNTLMIALAANGYHELYHLLDQGKDLVEFIKCPLSPDSRPEVEKALTYRPALLHGWGPPGYLATDPTIPEPELLAELAQTSGTPFLSVHLDITLDEGQEFNRQQIIDVVSQSVIDLKQISGLDILLENVPWYPWQKRPRGITDPDFISEVVRASNSYFLVDTAHAQVAAWHRGDDIHTYIAALPLDRALEIHTSGPRMADEGLRDRHMNLRPEDYALLEFTLDRTPLVKNLTLEYAGQREKMAHYNEPDGPELLEHQLTELDKIRQRRFLAT